jgi:hypothetical protein
MGESEMENLSNKLTPLALFGFVIVGDTAFNLAAVASVRRENSLYTLSMIDGSELTFAGSEAAEFEQLLTNFERHARFGGLPNSPLPSSALSSPPFPAPTKKPLTFLGQGQNT